LIPLLEKNLARTDSLIADVKSGVSGAGRKAEIHTLLCEASESLKAYAVAGHRHLPEISQGLALVCGNEVGLTFIPHLTPMIRGIHATLYASVMDHEIDLQLLYESRFSHEPFVDILPAGCHPETRSVRGSNMCRIAVFRPQGGDTVVILSVIDNLVKGAAGQAVQNMNIMFDQGETLGLTNIALLP
jgi:N-acetyl-gamma-glutamyl-phosphate reductase